MVDINNNAVNLTKENLKLNNIENATSFVSNIYSEITNKYDYIITNPPIRAGKETIRTFLFDAQNHINENGEKISPEEPNAYKYETLVLDMVKNQDSCLVYEVERNKEFAPVKNKTGVDSVDTARELLLENGIEL